MCMRGSEIDLSLMMDYDHATEVGAMVTDSIEVVVEVSNSVIHVFYVDTRDDGRILTDGELYHHLDYDTPVAEYGDDLTATQLTNIIVGIHIEYLTDQNLFEQTIEELLYRCTVSIKMED